MVRCPSCQRESAVGNFCSWCAFRLDATSAETEWIPGGDSRSARQSNSSSSVDEGRFLPGTVVAGRYRVSGLLGRGGMGEVYRATDLTLGQTVALKFLPEELARDERSLARFYNEVRIARQVTHPNVCRVYDIGQVEGSHFISMEFINGEDLASLLRRIGRLPVDKAIETARRLCAGLAAAHERGVLHRDLKPANVMIDSRGQVIIMDFGLAGLSDQVHGDVRSGTPAYMSPEQLAGTEVTFKSDLYALGLVLYEVFTGKRAFAANTPVELVDMQQNSPPPSITSVVKDLDPAVERVILRCLEPDPRSRPASALAIASALPGGDPLAAAMAAGETPSPELVAAAGETEGLPPRIALLWLAGALALLATYTVLAPTQDVTARLPLDNPPDALVRDARVLLQSFGYRARTADRGWGFSYDDAYLEYLKKHPAAAAARWRNPAAGRPPIVRLWYRDSPGTMMPERRFNVALNFTDPPLQMGGMTRLLLDPNGHLTHFEAVPPQVEPPAAPLPFDWGVLFQAAGLDLTRFQPTDPEWTPLANWDQRAAWTGDGMRVEAAAWRGRPVSFRIIDAWTPRERDVPAGGNQAILQLVITYSALLVAGAVAWRNFRANRADLRGAAKLGIVYWVFSAGSLVLVMHHSATAAEITAFWRVAGAAAIDAGVSWVFYLALEPWVRRRWPQTMVSWSRLLVRGARDPLVGRDLLFGAAIGIFFALFDLARAAAAAGRGSPILPVLGGLLGVRQLSSGILDILTSAVFDAVQMLFLLFVLRVLARKEWLAVSLFLAMVISLRVSGGPYIWPEIAYDTCVALAWAVVLLRLGLLAAIFADAVALILTMLPHTLDFSRWYAGTSLLPIVGVVLLAVYGFRMSLAGRPLFQPEPLQEPVAERR